MIIGNLVKLPFQEDLKNHLTLTPKTVPGYGQIPAPIPCFKLDKTMESIYVPRDWARKRNLIETIDNREWSYFKMKKKFIGELRDEQQQVARAFFSKGACHRTMDMRWGGGIIQLRPGSGKTCITIYILTKMQIRTLVVLPKLDLVEQWAERIQQFSDCSIGKMYANVYENVEDADIVLTTIQSISLASKYNKKILYSFGMVVYDEVHNVNTFHYCKSFYVLFPRYTLGLSATPFRRDGMDKISEWFIGPIVYSDSSKCIEWDISQRPIIRPISFSQEGFEPKYLFTGGFNLRGNEEQLVTCKNRNLLLFRVITDIIEEKNKRKILLLTSLRKHATIVKEKIDQYISDKEYSITTSLFLGGLSGNRDKIREKRAKQKEADIIFATYSMAKEGLDIPTLDTLILATPQSNIEQSLGRVCRGGSKNHPLVIDIVDVKCDLYKKWYYKRKKYYKKINTNVKKMNTYV